MKYRTSFVMAGKALGWMRNSVIPLLIASVVINIVLAQRVLVLRQTLRFIRQEGQLVIGQKLGPLELIEATGGLTTIRFEDVDMPTLIYVMRPTCPWCKRNNANLNALVDQATGHYRVAVVSTEAASIEEYRQAYGVVAPISIASPKMIRELRLVLLCQIRELLSDRRVI